MGEVEKTNLAAEVEETKRRLELEASLSEKIEHHHSEERDAYKSSIADLDEKLQQEQFLSIERHVKEVHHSELHNELKTQLESTCSQLAELTKRTHELDTQITTKSREFKTHTDEHQKQSLDLRKQIKHLESVRANQLACVVNIHAQMADMFSTFVTKEPQKQELSGYTPTSNAEVWCENANDSGSEPEREQCAFHSPRIREMSIQGVE